MDVCKRDSLNSNRTKTKNKRRRRRPEEASLFLMSLTTTRETAFSTAFTVKHEYRTSISEFANEIDWTERCSLYARLSPKKVCNFFDDYIELIWPFEMNDNRNFERLCFRSSTRVKQKFGNIERPFSGLSSVNTKTIRFVIAVRYRTRRSSKRPSELDGTCDEQRS